jgi:hypothetical protein
MWGKAGEASGQNRYDRLFRRYQRKGLQMSMPEPVEALPELSAGNKICRLAHDIWSASIPPPAGFDNRAVGLLSPSPLQLPSLLAD